MAGSLIATGATIAGIAAGKAILKAATRTFASSVNPTSKLSKIDGIPPACGLEANQILSMKPVPSLVFGAGNPTFFAKPSAPQSNPATTATPDVKPLNVPRGTK